MKNFANSFRGGVGLLLSALVVMNGLMVMQANAQTLYRTFNQNDLSQKKNSAGTIAAAKATFRFANTTGSVVNLLHVQFNAPVTSLDSIKNFSAAITSSNKNLDAVGVVGMLDTVTVKGVFSKKNIDVRATWSWGSGNLVRQQATTASPVVVQPNGGSVLSFLYKNVVPKKMGLVIGVAGDKKTSGWISYHTANQKFFSHTDDARCFDFLTAGQGTKKFLGEIKNPLVTKYNNHLLGEVHALKLAILANDARVTMPDTPATRLGDLLYYDSTDVGNPCNGKTLRQLTWLADTALTYCSHYSSTADVYEALDTSISRINSAFDGTYSAVSFSPFILDGTHAVSEYAFLHDNPTVKPTVLSSYQPSSIIDLPSGFILQQNYPNPFNPSTTIEFTLPVTSLVTLRVYNVLGQQVSTLYENEVLDDGDRSVDFNALNLSSGVYFYKISAQSVSDPTQVFTAMKRMMLIK